MTPERHRRAKELFLGACELAPEKRARFLDKVCDDAELREFVDALMKHYREPRGPAGDLPTSRAPAAGQAARLAAGCGEWMRAARLGGAAEALFEEV
jgi:hypothetical protein